jgi:hypothetical protein
MGIKHILISAVVAVPLLFAMPARPALAEVEPWPVAGKIVDKDGKKSKDVSGIACGTSAGFPRFCLVIDDNMQSAQFVTVDEGGLSAGAMVALNDDAFEGEPLELDGEGVAYADGAFYVIGSHGHPRDSRHRLDPIADAALIKARIAATSQIFRIALKSAPDHPLTGDDIKEVRRTSRLRDIIASQPELARFAGRRLENNGLTIEGVAVVGNRLYAGFRGPSLGSGRAPLLSVSLDALFAAASPDARLDLLPVGEGRGIRDLAPFGQGLLVLAGPTGDEAGAYSIYWWQPSREVQFLADITGPTAADAKHKPEAILPLDQGPSGLRILILSDGEEEGAPRPVTVPAP